MQELEQTKAKCVTIPKRVKRYGIAYYTNANAWENGYGFHATPEGALENFLRLNRSSTLPDYKPRFYQVFELELEIPIVP